MSEPNTVFLLDTTDGWILVDCGIDETKTDDPILVQKYFLDRGWKPAPVVLPVHHLRYQLSQINVEPYMIKYIILTHLHADHTGNLKHFPNAKIYIQHEEYKHGFQPQEKLVNGDMNILPGLDLILTRGHTPGHQSVRVELPSGAIIIMPGDAGDLMENYEKEILPGESADDKAALESIQRLKKLASVPNASLFLTHDPVLIQTLKLAPDYYD
ncbi:hypothetical protein I4U23_010832 [Adineta vaga]|nr:hypothetical protein I4U23_010832 [Adineta vaga]